MGQLPSGAVAPYLAEQIHKLAPDEASRAMAHAVVGAIVSYEAGNSAAAGAAGAVSGELMAQLVMKELYPGKQVSALTETEKQTISVLGTLAAGLAGGGTGDSAADGMAGAQAGKNSVENNALSSQDEKLRQDAKWSLPYIKDEKQKQQAEKLISDLNAKDKAFDAKLNAACKGLSSKACQGMRQELASMAKSYDEQLDGQYVGNMSTVYKEGKGQVDALIWQYATADAKAEREANVNRIAENWKVSKEAADGLYTAMAGVHTAAAIGGAIYGLKGESIPVAKGSTSETYFRVEGGSGTKTSQNRISANADGSVTINSGCSGQLYVSTNGPNHASYYLTNKRADGSVVVFEVDAALHKQIMDAAVPQKPIPGVPKDPNAPKIVDPNKGEPSISLELPKVWDRLIEQNSSKARVLTKEEFTNEFGK